eukprot:scaffold321993_cov21-Prasinocladus_malaysianus.AAC.1
MGTGSAPYTVPYESISLRQPGWLGSLYSPTKMLCLAAAGAAGRANIDRKDDTESRTALLPGGASTRDSGNDGWPDDVVVALLLLTAALRVQIRAIRAPRAIERAIKLAILMHEAAED